MPLPMNRRRTSAAFTLVELLVVLAIISILTALLLPSLRRARDSAKMLACASNLHQIGIAHQLYSNDNGDRMCPQMTHWPDGDYAWYYWLLMPYLGHQKITNNNITAAKVIGVKNFNCPATTKPIAEDIYAGYWEDYTGQGPRYCYGINLWNTYGDYNAATDATAGGVGTPRGSIRKPERFVFMGDNASHWLQEANADNISSNDRFAVERHNGRGNILLLDGHVESNKIGKFNESGGKYNWYVRGLTTPGGLTPEPTEPN